MKSDTGVSSCLPKPEINTVTAVGVEVTLKPRTQPRLTGGKRGKTLETQRLAPKLDQRFQGTKHIKAQQAGDPPPLPPPPLKGREVGRERLWNGEPRLNKERPAREVKGGGAKRQKPSGLVQTGSSTPVTSQSGFP